jgi:PAS domain S-box-containing protein
MQESRRTPAALFEGVAPGMQPPPDFTRLQAAVEATSLGIWEWDLLTGEVYWSERQREIFGVPASEAVTYDSWVSRLHPEDSAWVQQEARSLLDPASGGRMHIQHRLLLPSGGVCWIESHGRMIYEGGKPVRLLGTVTDITSRKQAEYELAEALSSLEVTLDGVDAVPWRYHTADLQLTWSPRIARLLKLESGSIFPSLDEFLAHVHPDHRQLIVDVREAERKALAGTKFSVEVKLQRADGSWGWMERRSISGSEDPMGRTIYGVDLDISCRKKIEEELAAAVHSLTRERERLNVALLVGQLGVYEWRIGEESVWWSPETYTLYGVDPGSFTPTIQSFSTLVHPADREELWRKSQQAIAQGAVFEHEYRIIRPDGEVRWIINRSHVGLSEWGQAERITGVAADITDRMRREEQIQLLMREVNHRSKNLLSVVQAVAFQTASASEPEDFTRKFSDRLQGIAASHDLLVNNGWRGIPLGELVLSQLAHLRDIVGNRIRITGPPVQLTPHSAQTLGMALHELTTNAVKYGALSAESGSVAIGWTFRQEGEAKLFSLKWREENGPPVTPPQERGFGTTVLTRVVEDAFAGKVALDYAASGVSWTLEASLDRVGEDPSAP